MNHTCPYNVSHIQSKTFFLLKKFYIFQHDLIVDKMWTGNQDDDFAKYIPFLSGDFAVFTTFYAYNIELSKVEFYIRVTR